MEEMIKKLAILAINNKLSGVDIPSKREVVKQFPQFVLPKATFITLKQNGKLRGCIGSLVAHRELYDDIIQNAQSAAFKDPRFKPLTKDELVNTTIEISLLTDAVLVNYDDIEDLKTKVEVGVDGIILKLDGKQSTFLPQVWEELNSFDLFFEHLCRKAGLSGDCLSKQPIIYKYQVEKIK
ncbi:MAG: AmmeMemoRadiSam system protein A [Arcobacteraceae bacterium]|nr:AmmeMemoRadiSam system protein A [Arcobacteraceae bacterium]